MIKLSDQMNIIPAQNYYFKHSILTLTLLQYTPRIEAVSSILSSVINK